MLLLIVHGCFPSFQNGVKKLSIGDPPDRRIGSFSALKLHEKSYFEDDALSPCALLPPDAEKHQIHPDDYS